MHNPQWEFIIYKLDKNIIMKDGGKDDINGKKVKWYKHIVFKIMNLPYEIKVLKQRFFTLATVDSWKDTNCVCISVMKQNKCQVAS